MADLWCVSDTDLVDLTPAKMRELIVDCFFHAQKETLARASSAMQMPSGDDDLRLTITSAVRRAFDEVDGDFEQPDKASIMGCLGVLARKAEIWGTPSEVIEHHKGEMMRAMSALPE